MKRLDFHAFRGASLAAALALVLPLCIGGAAPPIDLAQGAREETVDAREALRAKYLAIAEEYATFEWTATEENVFHGTLPGGATVNTPDVGYHEDGWHPDGSTNRGMPYSWGGFSSIEDFRAGLKKGLYAGNVPVSTKAMGSSRALGLDCSGFVARAWDLPLKQSTRTLGALCYELEDYEELLPGDILNIANGHVVLFKEWADEQHKRMRVFEAAQLRVELNEYPLAERKQRGFVPMRYKPLDERWVSMELEEITFIRGGAKEGIWREDPKGVYPELSELSSPLADVVPLEWAEYELSDSMARIPGTSRRTILAARIEDGRVDTQTVAELGGKQLMTGRSAPVSAPLAEMLIDFVAFEEPLELVERVAASAEAGEYELEDRRFPAHRISALLEMSWNMHGVRRPVTVEIEAVLSDAAPLQGVLEADFRFEIVWQEDEEGNRSVSERKMHFALVAFGGC